MSQGDGARRGQRGEFVALEQQAGQGQSHCRMLWDGACESVNVIQMKTSHGRISPA